MMARSLFFAGLLLTPVSLILYPLGLGFFAFYHAPQNATLLASLDEVVQRTGDPNMVLPHFVRNVLPSGFAGLVFASLFAATMSVFSSGLNSLSTATCMDFVQRLRQSRSNSKELTLTQVGLHEWLEMPTPRLNGKAPVVLIETGRWTVLADLIDDMITGSPT